MKATMTAISGSRDASTELRPRIVFVGAFPTPGSPVFGGVATACRALTESSLAERAELLLVDSTQATIPPPPLWRRTISAVGRIARFLKVFHQRRPDAALMMCAPGFSFLEKSLLLAYARAWGVPGILSPQGGALMDRARASRFWGKVVRVMARAPRVIHCQGPTWQRFFVNEMGLEAERCWVIENWTASPELLVVGSARKYHHQGPATLLFMGWVERAKGIMELLEAARRLAAAHPGSFRLLIGGTGGAFEEASAFVERNGLADTVTFLGYVEGPAKVRALVDADVFVLPSYHEGLPNAMIEAMAAGLPVVVTPVGAIPDVVDHGADGFIVPSKDAGAVEGALAALIADADLRERMGRAGYEKAKARFGVEPAVDRLLDAVAFMRSRNRTDAR
jgi:glycosyltransferase involved in cell wall biosynthesis